MKSFVKEMKKNGFVYYTVLPNKHSITVRPIRPRLTYHYRTNVGTYISVRMYVY